MKKGKQFKLDVVLPLALATTCLLVLQNVSNPCWANAIGSTSAFFWTTVSKGTPQTRKVAEGQISSSPWNDFGSIKNKHSKAVGKQTVGNIRLTTRKKSLGAWWKNCYCYCSSGFLKNCYCLASMKQSVCVSSGFLSAAPETHHAISPYNSAEEIISSFECFSGHLMTWHHDTFLIQELHAWPRLT